MHACSTLGALHLVRYTGHERTFAHKQRAATSSHCILSGASAAPPVKALPCSRGRRLLAWRRHEQPAVVATGKHPQHIELLSLGRVQQGLNVGLPTRVACQAKGQKAGTRGWGPAAVGSRAAIAACAREVGFAGGCIVASGSAGRQFDGRERHLGQRLHERDDCLWLHCSNTRPPPTPSHQRV